MGWRLALVNDETGEQMGLAVGSMDVSQDVMPMYALGQYEPVDMFCRSWKFNISGNLLGPEMYALREACYRSDRYYEPKTVAQKPSPSKDAHEQRLDLMDQVLATFKESDNASKRKARARRNDGGSQGD